MKEVVKELAGKFGIQVMLDSLSRLKGLGGGALVGGPNRVRGDST